MPEFPLVLGPVWQPLWLWLRFPRPRQRWPPRQRRWQAPSGWGFWEWRSWKVEKSKVNSKFCEVTQSYTCRTPTGFPWFWTHNSEHDPNDPSDLSRSKNGIQKKCESLEISRPEIIWFDTKASLSELVWKPSGFSGLTVLEASVFRATSQKTQSCQGVSKESFNPGSGLRLLSHESVALEAAENQRHENIEDMDCLDCLDCLDGWYSFRYPSTGTPCSKLARWLFAWSKDLQV